MLKHSLTKLRSLFLEIISLPNTLQKFNIENDNNKILLATILCEKNIDKNDYKTLEDVEFKIFSQFGDDGIIQYLVNSLNLEYKTFVEFGVEDYFESNTRLLLQKNNWSGFVMDGSAAHIRKLRASYFYWMHELESASAFITQKNINTLISDHCKNWGGIDLLHIDLDGMDYWVWEALKFSPSIMIVEYNSNFGIKKAISVPYNANFNRTEAHHSNLYWGASLKALITLSEIKGYDFIGCNSAGNNAYFIRKDKMNNKVHKKSIEDGFVRSKYRESRDKSGNLTFLSHDERIDILRGLPVYDIESGKITKIE